ncbi:MAG: nitroreductase family protein [Candidatus Hodarchaeales archaeon]
MTTDQLKQLLACAQLAPSLSEVQNFCFVIVDDDSLKQKVAEFTKEADWIAQASIIIAVVVALITDESEEEDDDTNIIDAIIATTQLTMAATANHLGSNLVVEFDQEEVKGLLKITDDRLEVIALVPVGIPLDEGSQGVYKRKLSELAHHNTFGSSWEF